MVNIFKSCLPLFYVELLLVVGMCLLRQSFKGALTSFGVMCKMIAHSIQSCLLYVPAKFQGQKTDRARATINFLRLYKTGNYFCVIIVCDVKVRLRHFEKTFCHGRTPIYKTMRLCETFWLCCFFRMSKDCRLELATFGQDIDIIIELSAILVGLIDWNCWEVILWFSCAPLICCSDEGTLIQTCLVQQFLVQYRFRVTVFYRKFDKFRKCRCFVLLHYSSYKLYYFF